MSARLHVGVAGLGRLGRVYAADLAHRVRNTRLVAVADPAPGVAEAFAQEYGVPEWYGSHQELLGDKKVDAVAVITPTSTHGEVVIDAVRAGKAVFCEKPIALSLAEAGRIMEAVAAAGGFLQMGFQRRFDAGYMAAKKQIEAGVIGTPTFLKSTSRDPFRPPLEFCDPNVSGGLIADMGIHDFDVARMFMGDVASVYATGAALAYPEMKGIGDIDHAAISLTFESGALGSVELSRSAVFGYDIRAEIWGTKGTLQVGYFRETPVLTMTREGITHDAVPHFMERFEKAYLVQIQDFVDRVREGREPAITGADAIAALRVSVAANRSLRENRAVSLAEIEHATFTQAV